MRVLLGYFCMNPALIQFDSYYVLFYGLLSMLCSSSSGFVLFLILNVANFVILLQFQCLLQGDVCGIIRHFCVFLIYIYIYLESLLLTSFLWVS